MVAGNILLNGTGFVAIPIEEGGELVHREDRAAFVPGQSQDGRQLQERIDIYTSILFSSTTGGIGRNRIPSNRSNEPLEYSRYRDAEAETRFSADVRLPILTEDSTEASSVERCRGFIDYDGAFWSLWDRDAGTSSKGVAVSDYVVGTTTWSAIDVVFDAVAVETVALDFIQHQGRLIVLLVSANDHHIYRSNRNDATTWTVATTDITTNLLDNNVTANEDAAFGLLQEVGGEAVAIVWAEKNSRVEFFSATSDGDVWAKEGVEIASVVNGVLGVAAFPGVDDAEKLYVLVQDGLWEIDTAPSTWTNRKVYTVSSSTDSQWGKKLVVHDGRLWFTCPCSSDQPLGVVTLDTSSGNYKFDTTVSLDKDDTVVSDLLGPANWLWSSGRFLFMSVGGSAASRNARILCHNGEGWHTMGKKHGTANRRIQAIAVSAIDDGNPRLHFAVRDAATTSDTKFMGQATSNPQSGVTIKREASGTVDYPEVDGGIPTVPAAWLQARVDAIGLSATNSGEYINIRHGLEGAARTTTDLGDILSGTKALKYASGAGEDGVSDAIRATLNRDGGDDTETPKLRSLEMAYLKQVDAVDRFVFQIDIEASAALQEDLTTEAVITNLEAARDLKTLPTFQYANITQTNVKIRPIVWRETPVTPGDVGGATVGDAEVQRKAFAVVTCEEIIA